MYRGLLGMCLDFMVAEEGQNNRFLIAHGTPAEAARQLSPRCPPRHLPGTDREHFGGSASNAGLGQHLEDIHFTAPPWPAA